MNIKYKMKKAAAGLLAAAVTAGAAVPVMPALAEEADVKAPKYVFL